MKRKTAERNIISTHSERKRPQFDAESMYAALAKRVPALVRAAIQSQSKEMPDWTEIVGSAKGQEQARPKDQVSTQ